MVLRVAYMDGPSHSRCKGELLHGARDCPPSCGEEPSLDTFLSVCLRCLVFASEHIWHISSHCASLQSIGAVLGVAQRDGRLFTGMPEAESVHLLLFRYAVSLVARDQVSGWRQLFFLDDGSCCWSRVNVRGRSHVCCSHMMESVLAVSCLHQHVQFQLWT